MSDEVTLSKTNAEMIAGLVASLSGDLPPESKMPCEVTVCVPAYTSIFTLPKVLRSTWFSRQGMPTEMFVVENGSVDGTQDFLRGLMNASITRDTWLKSSKWRALRVFELPQEDGHAWRFPREYYNIRNCFQLMFANVKTPYILTLDADVVVPSGMIRTLLEALKSDEKIGIVGVKYDDDVTHVKHGLSMMRTADARNWAARLQADACICSQWCRIATDEGYKCVNLPGVSARHLKYEND